MGWLLLSGKGGIKEKGGGLVQLRRRKRSFKEKVERVEKDESALVKGNFPKRRSETFLGCQQKGSAKNGRKKRRKEKDTFQTLGVEDIAGGGNRGETDETVSQPNQNEVQ